MSGAGLAAFESWMRANCVTYDHNLLELRTGNGGCGIFARRHVEEGVTLCSIPKAAILSVRNASIAEILEENCIGGGLGLIVAILHELSLGSRSKW